MRYALFSLADELAAALHARASQLDQEQAVYGLDSSVERDVQALFAAQLAGAYEVAREVYYPSSLGSRKSSFLRCDLVLSPQGIPLETYSPQPSLFVSTTCPPEKALWIEVKVAAQFRSLGSRSAGYGDQWRRGVTKDLQKMDADPRIHEAALVLVIFAESRALIEKDLVLFESHLVRAGVLAGFRQDRFFPLSDRIGHQACGVALWPTIQRG